MLSKGAIAAEDLDLCLFTDSIEEAVHHIKEKSIKQFGLKAAEKPRRSWWLFERGY
jgi:hypothetical protein